MGGRDREVSGPPMMRDKLCPVCGDDLASLPWGKGTVWQCTDHGVKEWYFDSEPEDDLLVGRSLPAMSFDHAMGELRGSVEFRRR